MAKNYQYNPLVRKGFDLTGDGGEAGVSGITRVVVKTAGNIPAGSDALTDYVYILTGSNTVTLPTAVGNTNSYTVIRDSNSTVQVASTSGQTFNGQVGPISIIVNRTQIQFTSDGSNWLY